MALFWTRFLQWTSGSGYFPDSPWARKVLCDLGTVALQLHQHADPAMLHDVSVAMDDVRKGLRWPDGSFAIYEVPDSIYRPAPEGGLGKDSDHPGGAR